MSKRRLASLDAPVLYIIAVLQPCGFLSEDFKVTANERNALQCNAEEVPGRDWKRPPWQPRIGVPSGYMLIVV